MLACCMASVGPDLLIAHLPRSGGRSLRHAALHGGLARPLSDSGHHESLESVLKDHGPRRFILGTYRPAAEWYRSIVTASLHWAPQKVWIDAWIECIGSDDPLDLVDAMLGVEGAPDLCGVDSHILSPSPGRSLFESNVISAYMVQDEAGPRVGLTHSIPMSCLPDAALSLGELLGSPLTLPHIRERETPSVSVSDFYRGARGQRLLEQIQERDGWMDDLLGGDWVKPVRICGRLPSPLVASASQRRATHSSDPGAGSMERGTGRAGPRLRLHRGALGRARSAALGARLHCQATLDDHRTEDRSQDRRRSSPDSIRRGLPASLRADRPGHRDCRAKARRGGCRGVVRAACRHPALPDVANYSQLRR